MASPQFDDNRIRDLIVAYYTKNDPQRLHDGIDIHGMVGWTRKNGFQALNDLLKGKYGVEIDLNDSTELNTNAQIARMSMAVSGQAMMDLDEMKKIRIASQLKKFYKKYDPSKLPSIFKLTEYALYKGEKALNQKLQIKYGQDLRTIDDVEDPSDDGSDGSESTLDVIPPLGHIINPHIKPAQDNLDLPAVDKESVHSEIKEDVVVQPKEEDVLSESEESKEVVIVKKPSILASIHEEEAIEDVMTPSPVNIVEKIVPEENVEEEETGGIVEDLEADKEKLEAQLTEFYKENDPDKILVIEALVLWALQLGRSGFNEKLKQLYGKDLDSPIAGSKTEVKNDVVETPASKRIDKPIRVKNKVRKLFKDMIGADKPSFARFEEAAAKSVQKADPLRGPKLFTEFMVADGEACDSYRIDMTQKLFGVCKCGHTKKAHF